MNESNSTEFDDHELFDGSGMVADAEMINRAMFYSALIMLTSCIVGFYGNIMSIIIFCHSSMRAPINVILTALSIIDNLLITLSVPVFILPSLNMIIQSEALHRIYIFGGVHLYPLSMMAHSSSIWTFVLVSIERYIAVCTPLKIHRLLTCRRARVSQATVVVLAILYNIPRFWEYIDDPVTGEVLPYMRGNDHYFIYYYVVLYATTHFLGPFTAILVLNIFVICSLKAADKDKLRRASRSERQQRKTSQMIILITLIFACFTTPPFVISMIEVFYSDLFAGPYTTHALIAMDVSNILVVLNSSSTFLLYLLYCQKYRSLFTYYMSKCPCYLYTVTVRKWSAERMALQETGISVEEHGNSVVLIDRQARSLTTYV